jgi:DNA-binding transcriptional ArsR family regulator
MAIRDEILAALKKLGRSAPLVIADTVGGSASKCGYHLRALEQAGAVKAEGRGRARTYALAGGAGGGRTKKKRKGRKARRAQGTPRQQRQVAAAFIPALTAGGGLLVVGHGAAPLTFTPDQAAAIADLLFQHYEA